ncbi:hypothetical protein B7463_g1407, partial [Scytalidium lignicola]
MKVSTLSIWPLCSSALAAAMNYHPGRLVPPIPPTKDTVSFSKAAVAGAVNNTGTAFFTQILDHNDPSKGTFQQRYIWTSEYWNGPGSPVVLFTPGETSADGYDFYLINTTIVGRFAQEIGGAALLLEHRFWGESSPYDVLNTENLQLLTLPQAIADFTYFAKNVDLPFDINHSSNADNAPWVFSGGSYSGSLAAWTESVAPGTFWAYHATSAPVEAVHDFWQYFAPIQENMPQNCSNDMQAIIEYADQILTNGTEEEVYDLKALFGLQDLQHNDDFAYALAFGPYMWQDNSFTSGYSIFFQFCDAVEGVEAGAAVVPGPEGIGAEKAIQSYGAWLNSTLIPGYCQAVGYTDVMDVSCFDSHNASNLQFTDYTIDNGADRQWYWMLCSGFDWWQEGAPQNQPSIVSRLLTSEYYSNQCNLYFPPENGYTYPENVNSSINTHSVNKYTEGWGLDNTTRLIWTNGEFDPWRPAGMSSTSRPGGPLASAPEHPVQIIPGGFHCSDLLLSNAEANEGVQQVVDSEVAQIVQWVSEWYNK